MEKQEIPDHNLILFDWLTFTSKVDGIESIKALLGLYDIPWEQLDRYMNGYAYRLQFEGITIMYGGHSEDMGICVNMSGSGCRTFETYSCVNWQQLFDMILSYPEDYNITRLDVAYDDHTGVLDLDVLRDDTDDHHYVSRSRTWKVEYGSAGTTIYHGSMKSNMMIRIYDKAAERGYDDRHWVRCELQMRDEIACGFVSGLRSTPVGVQFRGVLHNYLRYVVPQADSNMSRWPMTEYWSSLLEDVERIRVWNDPGKDYNIFNLCNYVINQAGNALDCYLYIFGVEDLKRELGKRSVKISPKYERLKADYELLKASSGTDQSG